jgi:hypothetical protein
MPPPQPTVAAIAGPTTSSSSDTSSESVDESFHEQVLVLLKRMNESRLETSRSRRKLDLNVSLSLALQASDRASESLFRLRMEEAPRDELRRLMRGVRERELSENCENAKKRVKRIEDDLEKCQFDFNLDVVR